MTEDESKGLLHTYFSNIKSLHFKALRRSSRGKQEIRSFAREQLGRLNNRFKSMFIQKQYMIVCQMLNYLVEPQLYRDGIDYYDEGMNINHASLVFMGIPACCGIGSATRLYSLFVEMFKTKTAESVRQFYKTIHELEETCTNKDFKTELFILGRSVQEIASTLMNVDKYVLDPAMHALIDLSGRWNDVFETGFAIVHDRSNSIFNQKRTLDFLINLNIDSTTIGYGKFKTTYPLRIKSFAFEDSERSYSIKLCDIVSGMLFCGLNPAKQDELKAELKKPASQWRFSNVILFSSDMEPMKDRKKQSGDIDPIDFLGRERMKENKGKQP
jgi:hypothetical protein